MKYHKFGIYQKQTRREALKNIMANTLTWSTLPTLLTNCTTSMDTKNTKINHSVCQWTYGFLPLEELCRVARSLNFQAIDLVGPDKWNILKKYNIHCSMCNGAEINLTDGWINPTFHTKLIKNYLDHIEWVSKAGYQNLICFSGNKLGMDPETGLKNMTKGIKKIISQAEKKGVTLHIEVFNSKINHPDYMADNTAWAIELCRRIDSQNFKILYDIYHMQISEGDIIRTIQDYHRYFGHYHTAGVPGRHEIDQTQELYYPAIMKAIVKTNFTGYVAQEFIPTGKTNDEKINALKDAISRCTV